MAIAAIGKKKDIRGGELVSRMLAAEGVERVFGIIDGTYFGLYSTLREHGIELVSPRHEACALHMAGAFARLSGKLGVAIASNGPGVANAISGVAVENAEGNRVLLITSSRREGIVEPDRGGTFQCFPQVEVTRPMTKWSCAVPSFERLAEILRRALRVSFSGRPGVVHVDVPESILNGAFTLPAGALREPGHYRSLEPLAASATQVAEAARLLCAAERPLLHVGSGVIHAQAFAEVAALAHKLELAITTSWGGRDALDERDPRAVPMIYLDTVTRARNEADVVLALGSRIGETDWWGKPPYWAPPSRQALIHVDIDAEFLANNKPADLPVQADVRAFLAALLAELEGRAELGDLVRRRAWIASLAKERRAKRAKLDRHLSDRAVPMNPAHVAGICQAAFGDDAVLVLDGGNTAIWGNFFHEVRTPGTVLGTPKMGMLGAGVAQALGAQVARPEARVYCIIGDGAMGFHMQEIETAVRHGLPVVYLVLCDRQWGMVKINQMFALKPIKTLVKKSLSPEETINADLGEIRFDDLARAMGAHGERVSDPAELPAALARCIAAERCAVVHVDVDPVKHMWAPALKSFKDMHAEPKG